LEIETHDHVFVQKHLGSRDAEWSTHEAYRKVRLVGNSLGGKLLSATDNDLRIMNVESGLGRKCRQKLLYDIESKVSASLRID
jgi:hypothetical protein